MSLTNLNNLSIAELKKLKQGTSAQKRVCQIQKRSFKTKLN